MTRRLFLLALSAVTLSACAATRGAKVESDNTTSYTVKVYNARNSIVTVSYDADASSRELGTVNPGATEQFVVISGSPNITLRARSSTGASLSSQLVTLTKPNAVTVTIR